MDEGKQRIFDLIDETLFQSIRGAFSAYANAAVMVLDRDGKDAYSPLLTADIANLIDSDPVFHDEFNHFKTLYPKILLDAKEI
jgi:ligand-binding sensor protein